MEHTKGELHRHDLTIHIEEKVDGKVVNHTCIANMNPASTAYASVCKEREDDADRIVLCWNAHDTLTKRGYDLDKELRDIRPYAACYRSVCKQLCIESNILGYIYTIENHRDKLLAACKALVEDGEYLEQDEGITACQCLAKAPDDIVEPPKCGYCLAKAAIEDK